MHAITLGRCGSLLTTLIRQALHRLRPMRSRQPTYLPVTVHGELPGQFIAARIRTAFFPTVRRGYQPEAVRHMLTQAADEITRLHRLLARVHAENDRIKTALKQWQTEHATTCRNFPNPDRRDWPTNHSYQHG